MYRLTEHQVNCYVENKVNYYAHNSSDYEYCECCLLCHAPGAERLVQKVGAPTDRLNCHLHIFQFFRIATEVAQAVVCQPDSVIVHALAVGGLDSAVYRFAAIADFDMVVASAEWARRAEDFPEIAGINPDRVIVLAGQAVAGKVCLNCLEYACLLHIISPQCPRTLSVAVSVVKQKSVRACFVAHPAR